MNWWNSSVQLGITEGTVKTHVKSLLKKFNAPGRTAAVKEAVHRGLVQLGYTIDMPPPAHLLQQPGILAGETRTSLERGRSNPA